ncbi:MAG: D-tyrosyl-tRNA(Tyr) deacylase [Desulfobacteraceae bacterium]|nr:MAG: D-tyrosyl-tRNA(Tyr) deacylase [Desulfobacteraceae bacterium]
MKAVVQRVSHASVTIEGRVFSRIQTGLVVLLGVEHQDTKKDADFLVEKIMNLRIFEDDQGKMNISLADIKGEMLVVSQFTLLGDCRKGRRPSFTQAAHPDVAIPLYDYFVERATALGVPTRTGQFGAVMDVALTNSGPVTLLLDTDHVS